MVGDGLAEEGPVLWVVDAFAEEGAFGKGEGVAFHPVLAAEACGGVGYAVDKGEVELFVGRGEGDGFFDFDEARAGVSKGLGARGWSGVEGEVAHGTAVEVAG